MKKYLTLVMLTMSFTIYADGFQKIPWGISENEIYKHYPNAIEDESGTIKIDYMIDRFDAEMVFYVFANGLQTIIIHIEDVKWNHVFESVFDSLCIKYGNPASNIRSDKYWQSKWVKENMIITHYWKPKEDHYIVYSAPAGTGGLF